MAAGLSLRFISPEEVTCPLVRHSLARRKTAANPYVFDRPRIARLVASIVETAVGPSTAQRIDLVEVYTANRYCAAIALHATKTAVIDYGFVELLADNVALEYLDHGTAQQLHDWFLAGQPEDDTPSDDFNTFEVDGVAHHVTGTMMLRDVACKFLDDIVPDIDLVDRLADRLLWRTADGFRPNGLVHAALQRRRPPVDVLPAFVAQGEGPACLEDQIALATTFVACHEIAHLAWSSEDQGVWRGSDLAKQVWNVFTELCAIPIGDDGPGLLYHLTLAARRDAEVQERIISEAFVDFRALDMMIERQRRDGRRPDEWASNLANLFALVSMTNSLGIFRSHMVSAILQRSIATEPLHLARSEAVTRNLFVLAYLELRHRELAGALPGRGMLPLVQPEWMMLDRRMIYFHLDLVGGRSDTEWAGLIRSVLG